MKHLFIFLFFAFATSSNAQIPDTSFLGEYIVNREGVNQSWTFNLLPNHQFEYYYGSAACFGGGSTSELTTGTFSLDEGILILIPEIKITKSVDYDLLSTVSPPPKTTTIDTIYQPQDEFFPLEYIIALAEDDINLFPNNQELCNPVYTFIQEANRSQNQWFYASGLFSKSGEILSKKRKRREEIRDSLEVRSWQIIDSIKAIHPLDSATFEKIFMMPWNTNLYKQVNITFFDTTWNKYLKPQPIEANIIQADTLSTFRNDCYPFETNLIKIDKGTNDGLLKGLYLEDKNQRCIIQLHEVHENHSFGNQKDGTNCKKGMKISTAGFF